MPRCESAADTSDHAADRFINDVFAVYRFSLSQRVRASVQVNVTNIADANQVVYLVNSANGRLRNAQLFNTPRKLTVSTSLGF